MRRDRIIANTDIRYMDDIQIYYFSEIDGVRYVPEPIEVHELKKIERGMYSPPLLNITGTMAQELMDTLWQCGIRPSEGTGSAGSLKATQNHLEDMRKITFKKLGIEE